MKEEIIKLIEKKIHEISVTKDDNAHWDGQKGGLGKAIDIIRNYTSKTKLKPTKKTLDAEKWVNNYIKKNGHKPTYQEISNGLGISKTATFYRCRILRECNVL